MKHLEEYVEFVKNNVPLVEEWDRHIGMIIMRFGDHSVIDLLFKDIEYNKHLSTHYLYTSDKMRKSDKKYLDKRLK